MEMKGDILVEGEPGRGEALVLTAPISFWGGVESRTGLIGDVRHPQHGENVAGRVLFVPGTIGSSSASAVLLELVHGRHAPAALILDRPDAILLLGLLAAQEMGWPVPVAVRLDAGQHGAFAGHTVQVGRDGTIRTA